ncbi:hypothetical protein [Mariniphaga sediminis]|uniref:hypothetical protein n=1 Tax=Mariniphaga sediminis TaxID=1628158 RepID=UPI003566D793
MKSIFILSSLFLSIIISPIFAQTSYSLIVDSPKYQYYNLKKTFIDMINENEIELYLDNSNIDTLYIFNRCRDKPWYSGSEYLGLYDSNDPAKVLADLAFEIARLEITFIRIEYPEFVWRDLLNKCEERLLPVYINLIGKKGNEATAGWEIESVIYWNYMLKLMEAMNDYRDQYEKTLPYMDPDRQANCGAGEISVYVKTEPSDGRVFFIPVFFYKLCENQNIDPNNFELCDRWNEPIEGQLFEIAGDYFYFAYWPDGVTRTGRFTMTKYSDGDILTFHKK